MIAFDVHDYVVVAVEGKRFLAITKSAIKKNKFAAILEADRSKDKQEHYIFEAKDVIANLGKEPRSGSVFGQSIEIFRGTRQLEGFGTRIDFYRDLDKDESKAFRRSIKTCLAKLEEVDLTFAPYRVEVREAKGKWAGYYKYNKRVKPGSDETDLIVFKPKEFDSDMLPNLIYHELGHSLWFRNTSVETRARWILQYHKAISLNSVTPDEVESIVSTFCSSGLDCKGFRRTLEDTREGNIFDYCLGYVEENHNLEIQHLNTLVAAGQDISQYFTTDTFLLQDMQVVLTDYAQVSPEEFFAEAFALHMCNIVIPKTLRKLMDTTISKAKNDSSTDDS